jgi:hypothetical protein
MSRTRQISLAVATFGAGYCLYLLVGFLRVIADNRLPWEGSDRFTREHYLAVGEAYSRGFVVGFFLCFCLAVVAFIVGNWYESSVRLRRAAAEAPALSS